MKKFLTQLAIYGGLFFLLMNGIAWASLFFLGRSTFYKPEFIKNGLTRKQYDYAVLGSSTGLTTLNTKLIDSITRKNGINISMDDSALSSHFLMLEHFLALGNKTDCLVLSIGIWDAKTINPGLNDNDYRFLPYISQDYVYDYYSRMEKNAFKPLTFSKYLPLLGVSYYNTELFYPSVIAALQPHKMNRFDDKGNYSYPLSVLNAEARQSKTVHFTCANPYFAKIEDLCAKHNIRLLYYISPIYNTKAVPDDVKAYINHSELLKDPRLFYDQIHVNDAGRKICSEALAKTLYKMP